MMSFFMFKDKKKVLFFSFIGIIFAVSLCFYFFHFRGFRYSFKYRISGSQKLVFETRAVPAVDGSSRITLYVEELLLGPSSQRARPFFPLGTRVLFCFDRNGTLFLNLSEQAVMDFSPEVNLQESYELLEMNVKANFPSIKKIELFINGNPVFFEPKTD